MLLSSRRRLGAVSLLVGAGLVLAACGDGEPVAAGQEAPAATAAPDDDSDDAPDGAGGDAAGEADPAGDVDTGNPAEPSGPPSDERRLVPHDRITGDLTPKSVVASNTGLVVANNMIYLHTVGAYSSDGERLAIIEDTIVPADHGYDEWSAPVRGGPVESAFSPDGSDLWVSNYSTYGPGFAHPGADECSPAQGIDPSFLYRIDTDSLEIVDAVLVGAVPKYVEVTPDGRYVLVTTWCDWTLSVVDTQAPGGPEEVGVVDIGRYPRGIAVSPDSSTAYVAVMGSSQVAVVDVAAAAAGEADDAVTGALEVGAGPRHLNLSPDGETLYVTLNRAGEVAKVDVPSGEVLGTVATGEAPRSSVLSPDGTALFVVNYFSDTVSRVRTSDLTVLETLDVDSKPIGITYDAVTERVWVAAYSGSLTVFDDAPVPAG